MNWSEVCVRVVGRKWDGIFTNRTATQQNTSKIEFSAFASILAISILTAYIHEYVRCSGGKVIYPINCQEFTVSKIWVESKHGSVVNQGRFNIQYSEKCEFHAADSKKPHFPLVHSVSTSSIMASHLTSAHTKGSSKPPHWWAPSTFRWYQHIDFGNRMESVK